MNRGMSASVESSTNDRPCSEVDTAMHAHDTIESTVSNTEEEGEMNSPLEEIRQESLIRRQRRNVFLTRIHVVATCLSLVIFVVTAALTISRGKGGNGTTNQAPKSTVIVNPLMQYRFQKIRSTLMDYTEPFAFLRHDSPHARARQWLYYRSGDLDVEDQDAVVQRYAILVLLCAGGGRPYENYVSATVENQTKHECEFQGVECDKDGNITGVSLSGQGLSGRVPKELRLLTNLRSLDLSSNALWGTFPNDILSKLSSLENLNLEENSFSSTLSTAIGSLTGLQHLRVVRNPLNGTLPVTLTKLSSLKTFTTGGNSMRGNILDISLSWRQLEHLQVVDSEFTGTIPSRIGDLANLGFMYLENLPLVGTLPEEVTTLSKLSRLSVILPEISGTIPNSIGTLTELEELIIGGRGFYGTLPTAIGELTKLSLLQVTETKVSGTIPTEIGYCSNIDHLSLRRSSFRGTIPAVIGSLSKLEVLRVLEKGLTGSIPEGLCSLNVEIERGCAVVCDCCDEACFVL